MVLVANSVDLQAALSEVGGTVTNFLEHLVGEEIDAQVHHHDVVGAQSANGLRVEAGEPLLCRAATLRGRVSGCSYVYAESAIVIDRLPRTFRHKLETGIDPIGRMLDEMGIAVTRQSLPEQDSFVGSRPKGGVRVGDCLLSRTYRIDSERIPLMIITEWFLTTLTPFLSSE